MKQLNHRGTLDHPSKVLLVTQMLVDNKSRVPEVQVDLVVFSVWVTVAECMCACVEILPLDVCALNDDLITMMSMSYERC